MAGTPPGAATDYSPYLKDFHGAILFGADPSAADPITDFTEWGNVADDVVAARRENGGSPFAFVTAYDPSSDLEAIQTKYDEWSDELGALEPIANVEDIIDAAVAKADTLVPTAEIDSVVDAFDQRSKSAYLRNVSRFAAGMFDIQAVMTTQFGMGLAAMEMDRQDQLNDVDARLRLMAERERYSSVNAFAGEMTRLLVFKLEQQRAGVGGQLDISRLNIIAYQDEMDKNLTHEMKDAEWDLDLWRHAAGVMTAINGAAVIPRAQTQGERLVSAFMTSGSFGIQVGTATGNVGLGVAAGVGSVATQLLLGGIT